MTIDQNQIIGLIGYAGTGKDTVARCLNIYGYERLAYADILKEMLYDLNPQIVDTQSQVRTVQHIVNERGWNRAKLYPEIRRLLQNIGTDTLDRIKGRDLLIQYVRDQIQPGRRYVITDVRFPDEVQDLRSQGAVLWRITRPGVQPMNAHRSELALDYIQTEHVIHNDGDLRALEWQVDQLVTLRSRL